MNTFSLRLVIVAFMFSHMVPLMAHVALDYPQGSETFIVGETISIQWHIVVPHNQLNWDLFFSPDGGATWDTIQLDIPTSNLSYEWVVPNILISQARIRVIQDNVDQNYQDDSMDFTIAPNTDPPLLDEPANDIIIACNPSNQEAAIQAWLDNHGGASVTNYCGDLIWTNDYAGYSNDCGATGSTLVIFTATDPCGSVITNATMTIADTNPPDIDIPAANLTVESNGQGNLAQLNAWLNSHAGAQASDECGDVSWSHNYTMLENGCGSTGNAVVTFTATDVCVNTSTSVATFTIEDHLVPTILVAAADTTLTCGVSNQQNEIQQWLDQQGGAEAFDIGGDVVWTHNFTGLSDSCGMTGSATVIFTATDECGNSASITAAIAVEDNIAPVITISAANATLECGIADQEIGIQQWLANHGGAQASDGCSELVWSHNYSSLSNGCGASGLANVIFTATDGCGNSSTTSAFIRTEDNVAPVMEMEPQDTTILCGLNDQPTVIQNWLNRQGGARASDQCGSVVWTNNFPALSDTCGPVGNHTIQFIAMDECGHITGTQAILTIMDSLTTSVLYPQALNFRIYPNPASDHLTITFDQSEVEQVHLVLFDAFGKVFWSGLSLSREIIIPLDTYPAGVYFLRVETLNLFSVRKVMID